MKPKSFRDDGVEQEDPNKFSSFASGSAHSPIFVLRNAPVFLASTHHGNLDVPAVCIKVDAQRPTSGLHNHMIETSLSGLASQNFLATSRIGRRNSPVMSNHPLTQARHVEILLVYSTTSEL